MSASVKFGLGALVFVLALAACDKDKKSEPPIPTPSATVKPAPATISPADEAKDTARVLCGACHGPNGKGDGPTAGTMNPKPRDFTNKDWQKSVTDAQIRTAIIKGGPAVGKSILMPANPTLESKPEVADALVQIVRGYAKP